MKIIRMVIPVLAGVLCAASSTVLAAGNNLIEESGFFKDLEKKLNGFEISDLDSRLGLKSISDKVYLSKENIFIIVLIAIVVLALFIVLIAITIGSRSRIKQLERDRAELKYREEALIEEKRNRIAARQRQIEQRRLESSRRRLVEVLKQVNEQKKFEEALREEEREQERLLEEQPWLRADRD